MLGGKIAAVLATLRQLIQEKPRVRLRGLAGAKPRLGGFRFAMQNRALDLEFIVFRTNAAGGFWRVLTQTGASRAYNSNSYLFQ